MNNKYIKYSYLAAMLLVSGYVHFGANTILEFLGATLVTFLLFVGIYWCLNRVIKGNWKIKILGILSIIVCLALLWVLFAYASLRQFNSYACKPGMDGKNIFTQETKTYCNFVPWYAGEVSDLK